MAGLGNRRRLGDVLLDRWKYLADSLADGLWRPSDCPDVGPEPRGYMKRLPERLEALGLGAGDKAFRSLAQRRMAHFRRRQAYMPQRR